MNLKEKKIVGTDYRLMVARAGTWGEVSEVVEKDQKLQTFNENY